MMRKQIWCCLAALVLPLTTFGQSVLNIAPIPSDPLELVTGAVETADTPAARQAALDLLARARVNFAFGSGSQGYNLKSHFVATSGGQTDFDGTWEMADSYSPGLGLRFTAKASGAFSMTRIASRGKSFSESTLNYIPLRLQEARAALFGPIPTAEDVKRDVIRTAPAVYNGRQVTCILLGGPINAAIPPGRRWEESEACIDPQSGLLETQSLAPGRYFAYEYSNGLRIAGHMVPQKITVTEGGRVVSEIQVDSISPPAPDAAAFTPTAEMRERGKAVGTTGALKTSQMIDNVALAPGAMVRPVVVFGVITPSGQFVEAHSLQPADPNSQAAVEAAKRISFSPMPSPPMQRFAFIVEKFVVAQ